MNIGNYLSDDEEILSKVVSKDVGGQDVHFYATNKRVIRHQKGLLSEKIDSLNYRHIISVSLESPSYIWMVLLGLAFTLLIPLGFSVGNEIVLFISGISFFIGPSLLIVGIIYTFIGRTWYQIIAPEVKEKDWRIFGVKRKNAIDFVNFIQDNIAKGNS